MKNVNATEARANIAMGKALRSRRAVTRQTIQEVADLASIPKSTVARYLEGAQGLNYGALLLLAAALGTDVSALVTDAIRLTDEG